MLPCFDTQVSVKCQTPSDGHNGLVLRHVFDKSIVSFEFVDAHVKELLWTLLWCIKTSELMSDGYDETNC